MLHVFFIFVCIHFQICGSCRSVEESDFFSFISFNIKKKTSPELFFTINLMLIAFITSILSVFISTTVGMMSLFRAQQSEQQAFTRSKLLDLYFHPITTDAGGSCGGGVDLGVLSFAASSSCLFCFSHLLHPMM